MTVKRAFANGMEVASCVVGLDFEIKAGITTSSNSHNLTALGIIGFDTDTKFPACDVSFLRKNELTETYLTMESDRSDVTEASVASGAGCHVVEAKLLSLRCLGDVKLSLSVAPSSTTTIRVYAIPVA